MVTLLSSTSTFTLNCLPTASAGLGVVAFHLAAVGAEHDDGLAGVGHRNAIAEGPHMSKPAGGESTPGVMPAPDAGQALVVFAVVREFFGGHVAVENTQKILRRHAMAGFIEKDRDDRRPAGDEARG